MFPTPSTPTCPWCNHELASQPGDGVCPNCAQPCGDRVFAVDVFEGKSRPRAVLVVVGCFFVLLTATVVLNALIGGGPSGDAVIFGLFLVVLLIITAAEMHGVWLMRRGAGSRRLILTEQGVEVINPHRMSGISSATWDEVDRIETEPVKSGGVRINVFTPDAAKASMRMVTASAKVAAEQVRFEIDRLRTTAERSDS